MLSGPWAGLAMNREDGANGNVDINVGRPVERIKEHHVWPTGRVRRRQDRLRSFLRGHGTDMPARGECFDERLMRKDVEFRHLLALDVLLPVKPRILTSPALLTSRAMTFPARAICVSRPVKSPVASGYVSLLFHDVSAQGKAQSTHGMTFQMQRAHDQGRTAQLTASGW